MDTNSFNIVLVEPQIRLIPVRLHGCAVRRILSCILLNRLDFRSMINTLRGLDLTIGNT